MRDTIFLAKSDRKNYDVQFRVLLFVMEKFGLIVKLGRQEGKWEQTDSRETRCYLLFHRKI
jgi:hypothetical protein